jgi:DNA-binding transcriptional LysR family regulator
MDRLQWMTVFRRVAELQSFSAAARELRLSNAAVSKHIAQLEDRLQTRLLHRTTRSVSLTADGAAYLARCVRILDDLDELDQSVGKTAGAPKGMLRVNAPSAFGLLHITPLVPGLLAAWPALTLDLSLTDRFVDLVEEGVDVVVRIATELPDSATLIAQRLVSCTQHVCATPAYLARRGTPRSPADLAEHDCISYGLRAPQWTFLAGGKPLHVPIAGRLRVDNSIAIRDACLADAGLAMLPSFYLDAAIREGRLRVVLPRVATQRIWIHAVYPRQRHLSTKVRVFIDHIRAGLAVAPWAIRRGSEPP